MTYQFFDIILPENDIRKAQGIILENGIKIVLISDLTNSMSSCAVSIGSGSNDEEINGLAHFLEHLLFMGSTKYPKHNIYHEYVLSNGGIDNAFTSDKITCYYLSLNNKSFLNGLDIFSYFFKEPLLDIKYIKSETNIIDSEHNKNINSESWIIDHLYKKFIKNKKFNKFSTGNNKSLKNITKDEIFDFYNKNYTSSNMCVSIIDKFEISKMLIKYIGFFESIPKKENKKIITKEDVILDTENNLLMFDLNNNIKNINIYLLLNCDNKNIDDLNIVDLINYIIGLEYLNSLCYRYKENNLSNNILSTIDHYYDLHALIKTTIDINNIDDVDIIIQYFNNYISKLSKITFEEFECIYTYFYNIKYIKMIFKDKMASKDIVVEISENLSNGFLKECVVLNNVINKCNFKIFNKFINVLKNFKIKYIVNFNLLKIDKDKFIKDEFYNVKYYITNYKIKSNIKVYFDYCKLIVIDDITNIIFNSDKVNFDKLPKLIDDVYFLDINKYNKPQTSISIIYKNNLLLENKYILIYNIYIGIIFDFLNYFLDPLVDYDMIFTMMIINNNLIITIYGFNILICNYVKKIFDLIEKIFTSKNIENIFNKIKTIVKNDIQNNSFNNSFELCNVFLNIVINDFYKNDELLNIIDTLTFEDFKTGCILINNSHFKKDIIIIGNTNIDKIKLNIPNTKLIKNKNTNKNIFNINFKYKIPNKNIHNKNNCIIVNYVVYNNNNINYLDSIKYKTIFSIIENIIIEPVFTQLRTIDKLGYIVKCFMKYDIKDKNSVISINYMVQSNFKISKLLKHIVNFNLKITKDCKKYKNIYMSLKKNIMNKLDKKFSSLKQEMSFYIDLIVNDVYNFDIKQKIIKIIESITFEDIIDGFNILSKVKYNTIEI